LFAITTPVDPPRIKIPIELLPGTVASALRMLRYSTVRESASGIVTAVVPPCTTERIADAGRVHVVGWYPPCTLTLSRIVRLPVYVPNETRTLRRPNRTASSMPVWI